VTILRVGLVGNLVWACCKSSVRLAPHRSPLVSLRAVVDQVGQRILHAIGRIIAKRIALGKWEQPRFTTILTVTAGACRPRLIRQTRQGSRSRT
jgi:hypothetical protein